MKICNEHNWQHICESRINEISVNIHECNNCLSIKIIHSWYEWHNGFDHPKIYHEIVNIVDPREKTKYVVLRIDKRFLI